MFTFLFTVLDIWFITTLQVVICVVASLSISNQYSCFIIFTQTCYTCIQNCARNNAHCYDQAKLLTHKKYLQTSASISEQQHWANFV